MTRKEAEGYLREIGCTDLTVIDEILIACEGENFSIDCLRREWEKRKNPSLPEEEPNPFPSP